MHIQFGEYTFSFWLITTLNRYEPEDFEVTATGSGLTARARHFSFGEGSGTTDGGFEVTITQEQNRITWTVDAAHAEPIKGVKVSISPLPVGTVMVPLDAEFTLKDGDPGRCFAYPGGYYPIRHISSTWVEPASGPIPTWAAQLAIIRTNGADTIISSREYPPRVKKIWFYHKGDHQEVHLYTEANASQRALTYQSPAWTIETVSSWRSAVKSYADWMAGAYQIPPFEQRTDVQPWLKEIQMVVIFHGETHDGKICFDFHLMADRVKELAQLFPANRVLIKITAFEGRIDRNWPEVEPAPALGGLAAFERLVSTAHELGYHLMPHLNVWGASYENTKTRDLLQHQIYDPEGRPSTWSYDYDQDEIAEEIFAYISPDAPEWRAIQKQNVGKMLSRGMDAIYLDQTGTFINDLHHDHFRGLQSLYHELREAYPRSQFAGEAPVTEVTAHLCSLICGIPILNSPDLAELYQVLFGPYIRCYGYNLPPETYRGVWGAPGIEQHWSEEQFRRYEERSGWVNGIPTLNLTDPRIRLDSILLKSVLERARTYQIVKI